MMDLQSALVCVLVFVVSGTILFLISMFGMREKSYEEALAEQRQLTGGLLNSGKLKTKDKKPKKTGKKVKEKPTAGNGVETKDIEDRDLTDVKEETPIAAAISVPGHAKLHVEFEEPAVIEAPVNKDKKKLKKVKPILINKEKSPVADTTVTKSLSINHFEKIHPKDEYEMLHVEIKEEVQVKQEKQPETETKPSKASKVKVVEKENEPQQQQQQKTTKQTKDKKTQQQPTPSVVVEEIIPEQPAVKTTQQPQQQQQQHQQQQQQQQSAPVNNHNGNTVKDKKKKKSEFNTLQQMTASDKPGVNVSLLVPLVRKADLSRSEIQILIDLLLNKQHDGPTIIDEWSEGRSDPVQKLKKQLAEKDRLLTEEQEALVSAQAKLREVRAELNSERSRLLQNYRNLEETVHAKHTELQAAAARLHTQNQKLQQIQVQMNEEAMVSHKLRQELSQMQMQRQQMDMHLNQQKQEVESTFQTQVTQLRNELQEQQNLNAQLNMEIRNLRETGHAEKELLTERVRQVERDVTQYKTELNQRELMTRQLEEYGKMLQNKIMTLESENAQLEAANGAQTEDRNREIEVLNLQNELASQRVRFQQQEKQFAQEVEELKTKIRISESEIQTQKNKNDVNVTKVRTEEQEKCRKFVQRLFPDVQLSNNDNWMTEAENTVKKFISDLEKRKQEEEEEAEEESITAGSVDVARLQAQVSQYRNIIEDTEGMLNRLQSHIEIEEINWRKQLQSKDSEIEVLKEQCKNQLQSKIGELEEQLSIEQEAKRELELECEALKDRISDVPITHAKHTQYGSLADAEQAVEEQNRLAAELLNEQKRCQELSEELLRLKSNVSTKVVQNHTNGTSMESADATVNN